MDIKDIWQVFLETGAPEMYLLYNKARRMGETNVSEDPEPGAAGHSLQ